MLAVLRSFPCLCLLPLLLIFVVSSDKLSGIGVRPRLASSVSGPKVVTSASAHSSNWKKVLGLWCELVSRHATCSPHFAGALDSEHKEVLLSQMLASWDSSLRFVSPP